MVEIKEGRYYRTRDGRKVGPARLAAPTLPWPWDVGDGNLRCGDGLSGGARNMWGESYDIVSEWYDPIVTVTRRELRDGEYGRFSVMKHEGKSVIVGFSSHGGLHFQALTADELREAAHLFTQIAEFLEEGE